MVHSIGGTSVRQTSEQIDRAILDTAAHLFAVHGFAGTSVQQVADAVGYSKTGLLHRFPSKRRLYDAVIEESLCALRELLAAAEAVPAGESRVHEVLTLFAAESFARPGQVELLIESFRPRSNEPGADELKAEAFRLIYVLDTPLATAEERLRLVLALQLVVNGALSQSPVADTGDLDLRVEPARARALVVDSALAVLGGA